MESCIIIDFQGFKDDQNNYVVKELSMLSKYRSDLLLFSPPFNEKYLSPEIQELNLKFTTSGHGFFWNDGSSPYVILESTLVDRCKDFDKIIIAELEKVRFMQNIIKKEVTYLKKLNFGDRCNFPETTVNCWYDHNGYDCAFKNVHRIWSFLSNGQRWD